MLLVVSPKLYLLRVQFLEGRPTLSQRVFGAHFEAGGDGVVAARTLRDLNGRACLLGVRGDVTGSLLRNALAAEGIEAHLLPSLSPTPMLLRIYEKHEGKLRARDYLEDPGRLSGGMMRAMTLEFESLLPDARGVLLSGSSESAGAEFFMAELARKSAAAGVPLVIQSEGNTVLECLGCAADSIVLRAKDWQRCIELRRAPAGELLEEFFAGGGKTLLVTNGAQAVRVFSADAEELRLYPPKIGDRGGKGACEAVAAGQLFRLAAGWDSISATSFGIAAGTAQTLKLVGGRLSPTEIEGFFRQVRGESLPLS